MEIFRAKNIERFTAWVSYDGRRRENAYAGSLRQEFKLHIRAKSIVRNGKWKPLLLKSTLQHRMHAARV